MLPGNKTLDFVFIGVLSDSDSNLRQEIDGFLKETKYFENYPENEKGREEAEEEGCVMSS